MMRRIILILTAVLLLIPAQANAQNTQSYQLRIPSVDEYLHTLDSITPGLGQLVPDVRNLLHDFIRHYILPDPTISFAKLAIVYRKIYRLGAWYVDSGELAVWNGALISAWLKDHPRDLNRDPQFVIQFDQFPFSDSTADYEITATRRVLKGDGSPQWLLTVTTGEKFSFGNASGVNYLLAIRDAVGNYHVYSLPIPWVEFGYGSVWDVSNTILHPLYFQDLNGEDRPVWIFSSEPYGYYEYGGLYVLAWQNGQVVDLIRTSAPTDYGVIAAPRVGSVIRLAPSQVPHVYNILIQTPQIDNWGCLHIETQIVDWNRMQWLLTGSTSSYADTAGCQWRKAESAMWEGDYPTAIAGYRAGLLKMFTDVVKPNPEMVQYIQIRLTLALMLNGQSVQASILSTALKLQSPASEIIRQLIGDLPLRPVDNPYPICFNVRNVFQKFIDRSQSDGIGEVDPNAALYSALPIEIIVGMTWDDVSSIDRHPLRLGPYLPDPSKAGCNITPVLLAELRTQTFNRKVPLVTQLDSMGFQATDSVSLDINHDGQIEWLVWLQVNVPPLFFSPNPDGQTYHVSYAPFTDQYSEFTDVILKLPSNNGYALTDVQPDYIYVPNGTAPKVCTLISDKNKNLFISAVSLAIYQMHAGELVQIFNAPTCDPSNAIDPALLPYSHNTLPDSFDGYAPVTTRKPGNYNDLGEVIFTWNNQAQTYLPPPSVDQPAVMRDAAQTAFYVDNTFDQALKGNNAAAALEIVDQVLATDCSQNCDDAESVNYHMLRATALEMLGHTSEAIAEYLFVANNATSPDQSALAMMHLTLQF